MPKGYWPGGPFIDELPDRARFDVAQESFLLEFASYQTARAYKADLDEFYDWCVEAGADAMSPTPVVLDGYLAWVESRGYARGSVLRRRSALRGFVRHLHAANGEGADDA